jgi:hypothetical protein
MVYGSCMASFTVPDFSLDRLKRLTRAQIEKRFGNSANSCGSDPRALRMESKKKIADITFKNLKAEAFLSLFPCDPAPPRDEILADGQPPAREKQIPARLRGLPGRGARRRTP